MNDAPRRVLVTGGAGYIGSQVVARLAQEPQVAALVALDVRPAPPPQQLDHVTYLQGDIRDTRLVDHLRQWDVNTVVHLASIVSPGGRSQRDFEYSVDVLGTRNVIDASLAAGVDHLIVTSSGAAYGYHADNPRLLRESDPLRGNRAFAYADHKRQVEEMLAQARDEHPALRQLVFRPGTVLGRQTDNQITNLFQRRWILGLRGCETPFVFIWDQDVVACIARGVIDERQGIYNLAGDGTLSLREIASRLGKPYVALPATLVRAALAVLSRVGLTRYGPEQVMFLQYRPVLANERLKREFGFVPAKTSEQALQFYIEHSRESS